jgi:cytochrome c oxidase subunit II
VRRICVAVKERMQRMRDVFKTWVISLSMACLAVFGVAGQALAAALGEARPWQINFQPAYSPVMERVHDFHHMLLIIITSVVLLVLGVLGYVIFRFNAKRNPVPSKTAHNTVIEFVWTVVPVLILVIIAIPSLKLLYYSNKAPDYEMTLKVTGHQWYWTYTYPDQDGLTFDSIPIPSDELKPGQPRLLAVDNPVVLPVGTKVQVLVNSDDVIHDWAVPSLGLKKDATPGRVNEAWVEINAEGTYYGMCSELCGVNHYFMPIQIEAVSKEAYAAWVKKAKEQFATNSRPTIDLASSASPAR